jgi:coenzyme PQQ precursor peptide PqqA
MLKAVLSDQGPLVAWTELEPEIQKFGEFTMREWHKPTIEETESGMEVTSYLPAELDRA